MKSNCKLFFLLILFFVFAAKELHSQNRKIDSLLTLLKIDKPDTNKVIHLNKLSWEYINVGEFDSGMKYGNKAIALASSLSEAYTDERGKTIRGWAKGIASGYNNIGIIYSRQGNYPAALKNYFLSLKIWRVILNKQEIAQSYINIGNIYVFQGNYNEALKIYFDALKIKEEIKDKKGIATSYHLIGNLYWNQSNYAEALKNYFSALRVREEIKDKKGIASSYNNIGNIYVKLGDYPAALKNYMASLKTKQEIDDKQGIAGSFNNIGLIYRMQGNYPEALNNYNESLKIREDINDKYSIADSYNNIGLVYYFQGKYSEALKKYFASLKIYENFGNKHDIANTYSNLSDVETKLGKLKEAQKNLDKALQIAKEIGDKETIRGIYLGLAVLDSMQGNWKAAYTHHKLLIIYKDSIDNEETKKKTIESTMNYEFEKKESATKAEQDKKDAVTTANKKRQQIVLLLVSCVLLFVFVFAGFVVRSLRVTRKQKHIIELQKNEVFRQKEVAEKQKDEAEKQKELVQEKQKEIVASITYAKRIQTALLTSDEYINNHLPAEHFILFKPKDIVSGDFYWALSIATLPGWDMGTNKIKLLPDTKRKNTFYMATADCTGHGVPGAFMSMLNISYLNENIIERRIRLPHDILNSQRKEIIEALNPLGSTEECKDGMDCTLCVYDFDKMLLHFAAANNPLWLVRNNELKEYKADKMPVGKYSEKMQPFALQTIELQKGDIIYTSTDGFADQFGTNGKKLMKKKFKEELLKIHQLPMNEQKEYLNQFFENWKGKTEQVDDITIIGIRI